MNFLKRVSLFIIVNLAILIVLSLVFQLLGYFGIQHYVTQSGIDLTALLIIALVIGFGGSFLSLLMAKSMAKWMMKVQIIKDPRTPEENHIFQIVQKIALQSNIKMPEIGIYPAMEVNAFATGASKNNSLVAVSQGLLEKMDRDEIEGVIAHEMAHIINGDMVTLTLIQGVVNTFVIFLSRLLAQIVGRLLSKNEEMGHLTYFLLVIAFDILFGILASLIVLAFSRHREFRADAGSAQYVGKNKMIKALQKLQMLQKTLQSPESEKAFAALKISDKRSRIGNLFSSHPALEKRIEALQKASL